MDRVELKQTEQCSKAISCIISMGDKNEAKYQSATLDLKDL